MPAGASVTDGSRWRAYVMLAAGLLLSMVGTDLVSGQERFTFGSVYLRDGFGIAVVAMGLFGVSEVLVLAEQRDARPALMGYGRGMRDLLPSRQDWRESAAPIARGTVLGFFLGLLPGAGALLASYVVEKRLSRRPETFGQGAIAGVAGPESANNPAAQSSFIPLLCLGIPANATIGVIVGALLIHGITPGPRLLVDHPGLFWGVITSMFIGNAMLIVLNLPLVGLFVSLLRVPQAVMAPLILMFCGIGAYSLNNSADDVVAMAAFGILGWGLRRTGLDPAPLLLAFVLGSLLERSLRQALLIGYGSPIIFVEKPIAAAFLAAAVLALAWPLYSRRRLSA